MNQAVFETPILFLIFNRPDTTQEVFNKIREIKPRKLFVAADGPRAGKTNEEALCQKTRSVISQIDWPCELKTLFREKNLGCGMAVSSAITWYFEQVEYGIILEDDCLPDLSFFPFCEELLVKYKDDEKIMLIGGTNFLNAGLKLENSYFFSQYPHIWGWASWSRAWKLYDYDMTGISGFFNNKLNKIFKTHKQRKYFRRKLFKTSIGEIKTWDYQWVYSILNNDGIAITPVQNLIVNIGFRNESTHTFLKDPIKENEKLEKVKMPLIHPQKEVNLNADLITFNNAFGYSIPRLIRLLKENGVLKIIKYFVRKT